MDQETDIRAEELPAPTAGDDGAGEGDRPEHPSHRGLSPDRPLVDPSDDRLGYAAFAQALAEAIRSLDSPDGIVVGIYGAWGLGKTTALNFVERYLVPEGANEENDDELVVLRFNPWLFTGRLDLAAVYLLELQKVFQQRELATRRAREALASLLKLAGAVPVPGSDAGTVLAQMVDPGVPDIRKQREEVRAALAEQPQRLVVVIDDMDRLTAQEIKELFSVIKSVADFPNTIYLLAFDKDVVAKALVPDKPEDGMAYIEKIVQVPFELPLPEDATLQGLLVEQLHSIVGEVHEDLLDDEDWGTSLRRCVMPLIDTPRDVVRLTNSLKVTYGAVRDQVNVVDFILVEAARVFLPPLYEAIRTRPEMFGVPKDLIQAMLLGDRKDEQKAFHEKWLAQIADSDWDAAKNVAGTLFPSSSEVLDTLNLPSRAGRDARRERRITEPENFSLYFSLALGEESLPREAVLAMVEAAGKPKDFCDALLDLRTERIPGGRTRASVMLDELIAQTESGFREEDISSVIPAIVSIGDELWLESDEGPLMPGNDLRLFWFVEGLLNRLPKADRTTLLGKAIEQADSVATPVRIVQGLAHRLDVRTGSVADASVQPVISEHAVIDSEGVLALEKVAAARVAKAASDGSLYAAPRPTVLITKWGHWGGADAVRAWLAPILEDDEELGRLLVALLHRERTDEGQALHRLNPAWLEPYASREELASAVNRLKNSADGEVAVAVDAFQEDHAILEAGGNPDDPFRDLHQRR
jgi:predicted KAP-like P-loop ATPase